MLAARLVRRGYADVDPLDEDDEFRFRFYLLGVMTEYANAHYQYHMGMLDEDRWQQHRNFLHVMLRMPGVARWWSSEGSAGFRPEFAALVSEILGEEAEGSGLKSPRPA